jgi:hypothetical protein
MSTTPLDHTALEHLGAVYFSEESAFGTAGTERRAAPVTDTVALSIGQASVDAMTLSPIPFDARTPMQGNKTGTVAFSYYLQPSATLLDELGTLPTDATMPGRIPLRVVFGGESIPDVGTQAATPTSATAITVDAADGANFPAGQVVAVYTNSTVGLEVAQVRSRSTDDLTLYPALTATPANNADVVQMVCYYPTRTNARTLSFAGSGRNTSRQYRLSGCTGTATIKFEANTLAVAEFNLTAATHTGPSALSLSVARSEDPAGAPLAARNSLCWLQPVATTTRVDTAVDAVEIALNFGNIHLTSLTGTLEGKRAAHRGEGLNESFAKITLTMPDNTDVFTWYDAQTELNFTFIVRAGAVATRRHVVVMAPQCVIESIPERIKGEGNLTKLKVVLRAKVSEQCSGSLDNEELAQAPFVLALG